MGRRKNRSRRTGGSRPDERRPLPSAGLQTVQRWFDGDWVVRAVSGSATAKSYRCPGCDQLIMPATPHVVTWPADDRGGLDDRRHWHTGCWNARDRRGPR